MIGHKEIRGRPKTRNSEKCISLRSKILTELLCGLMNISFSDRDKIPKTAMTNSTDFGARTKLDFYTSKLSHNYHIMI